MKSYSQTQGFPTAIIMAAKNKKITCSIFFYMRARLLGKRNAN